MIPRFSDAPTGTGAARDDAKRQPRECDRGSGQERVHDEDSDRHVHRGEVQPWHNHQPHAERCDGAKDASQEDDLEIADAGVAPQATVEPNVPEEHQLDRNRDRRDM